MIDDTTVVALLHNLQIANPICIHFWSSSGPCFPSWLFHHTRPYSLKSRPVWLYQQSSLTKKSSSATLSPPRPGREINQAKTCRWQYPTIEAYTIESRLFRHIRWILPIKSYRLSFPFSDDLFMGRKKRITSHLPDEIPIAFGTNYQTRNNR